MRQTQPSNVHIAAGSSRSTAFDLALLGLTVVIAVLSFAKNFSYQLNPWGDPYFFFSYADGFIKRGLVGHIFNTIYPGASPEATRAIALLSCTVASLLIVAAHAVGLAGRARLDRAVCVVCSVTVSSDAWV